MKLALEGSGISYEPGDVVGVRCPNSVEATAYILERLQVSRLRGALLLLTLRVCPWFPEAFFVAVYVWITIFDWFNDSHFQRIVLAAQDYSEVKSQP